MIALPFSISDRSWKSVRRSRFFHNPAIPTRNSWQRVRLSWAVRSRPRKDAKPNCLIRIIRRKAVPFARAVLERSVSAGSSVLNWFARGQIESLRATIHFEISCSNSKRHSDTNTGKTGHCNLMACCSWSGSFLVLLRVLLAQTAHYRIVAY